MIRRIIGLLLVAMICSDVVVSAENYAILISAGKATSDNQMINSEYWYDLFLIYEHLLLNEQYDSSKVFVFYGDGIDYNSSNNRYRKELHNWGQIADYDNSYYTLNSVISSLNSIITDEDNLLFYWVVGHGDKLQLYNVDSYYARLRDNPDNPSDPNIEYVTKLELVELINSITHYNKRKIFWMTCVSGAMGEGTINVNNNKTTLLTSSTSDELSYSDYYNNECHSNFDYALFSLSSEKYPNGNVCNVNQYCLSDAFMDSLLTMSELHSSIVSFIISNSIYIHHPCKYDIGGISNKTFIGESKRIKNVTIDANSSYWIDTLELSNVIFDDNIDINIYIDKQCKIIDNTYIPTGTTMSIK